MRPSSSRTRSGGICFFFPFLFLASSKTKRRLTPNSTPANPPATPPQSSAPQYQSAYKYPPPAESTTPPAQSPLPAPASRVYLPQETAHRSPSPPTPAPSHRARRRRHHRRPFAFHLKHRAPNQIRHKILPRRQNHPLLKRQQHIQLAKFLRLINRLHPRKMNHTLPAMILAQPARFYANGNRLRRAKRPSKAITGNAPQKYFR